MRSFLRRVLGGLKARPGITAAAVVGFLSLTSLGAGIALGTWSNVCHDCPSIAQIYAWEPLASTKILAHDGKLVAEIFQERRTPVALSDLPPYVPQAFLAVEDKRFYQHGAFDPIGLARAVVSTAFGNRQGGSTITQQLARNIFIQEVGFEQTPTRKLKELRVAQELERAYTKDQILEAYINQINYGPGWWGIETAAQRYFGKRAVDINPAEAAMLAAVINLPGRYSPFKNPDLARSRRNLVLGLMAEQGFLTREDAERWKQEPLPESPHGGNEGDVAPYFVEWVREILDDRYGSALYSRGLRVYTTLDLEMQRRAQAAMLTGWQTIESMPSFSHPLYADVKEAGGSPDGGRAPYLQGLFIALDPASGDIRALIGGRDFRDSKFNRVTQARRQPGSVFKPFVYTAAIGSGVPASHVIFDSPLMLEQPNGEIYAPKNYDGTFDGPMTLREGLRRSVNLVTVKLALEIGLETVAQYAARMGIESPIPRVPSMAIGAADLVPLEIAEAYAVFANQGAHVEPRALLRVEDSNGRVLWEAQREQPERVLGRLEAALMLDLLRDVVDHGTAYAIRDPARGNVPTELAAAGKTGTTNDNTDIWFAGFTPDLLAMVWFGFDMPKPILPVAAGGSFAAPVWGEFMRSVYFGNGEVEGEEGEAQQPLRPLPTPWVTPADLTTRRIDRETGKLATEWCPLELVYSELYVPGTEPAESCDLHGPGILGAPLRDLPPESIPDSIVRF